MAGASGGLPTGLAGGLPRSQTTLPNWMLNEDDLGQTFVLLLQRKFEDKEQVPTNVTKKDDRDNRLPPPFIIGESIELVTGAKEAKKVVASKEARGSRYILRISSKSLYDKLTSITTLTDGTKVEVIPHPNLNTIQGVVYEEDSTEVNNETLLRFLEPQGVHFVRRITKRVNGQIYNTPLIVLSFHGTVLPTFVYFGPLRIPVRPYYPSPMMCFNCGAYGHPRKFCQQPSICLSCSQSHQLTDGEQCTNTPFCLHCKGAHPVSSRQCAKFKAEESIIRMKVDKGLSFSEARKIYAEEINKQTFSSELQKRLTQEESTKDKIIAELRKEINTLKTQLQTLMEDREAKPCSESRKKETARNNPTTGLSHPNSNSSQNGQNNRPSRKDKYSKSPTSNQKDNKKADNLAPMEHDRRTRSRSGKHLMEISPVDSNHTRGKRPALQPNTGENTIDIDE